MKTIKVCISAIVVLLLSSAVLTGCGGGGGGSAAPAALRVPSGVTATPGNGNATIAWTAVPGATSYNVYMSTTPGVTPANGSKVASTNNFRLVTGLTNGTTYYFVVTAIVGTAESAASAPVSAKPIATPPPAPPTGVIATPGNGQVTINWSPVPSATSYNIYWSTSSGVTPATGTKIAGVTAPAPPYTLTGRTNGTAYFFVVTAVNANGESVPSAPAVSATPTAAVPPAAPTGVTATGGDGQVTIAWLPVAGATSYNIYWATAAGVIPFFAGVTQITGVTNPFSLPAINGTIYFVVVTAVNASGESALSAEVSALASATPGPPFIQATVLSLPGVGNPLFWLQHVDVYTDSTLATPITNATVIVNGTTFTYDPVRGTYNTITTFAIAPGAPVDVSVAISSTTYTATGTQFTTFPILNQIPPEGNVLFIYVDNTWTWTAGAPTAPPGGATYLFGILDTGSLDLGPHISNAIMYPLPVNTGLLNVPTSSTSWTVPLNTLIPGEYQPMLGMATAGVARAVLPGVVPGVPAIGRNTGGIPGAFAGAAAGSGLWIGEITVYSSVPIILNVMP